MTPRTASLRLRLAGTLGACFLVGMVALYVAAHSYGRLAADRSYDRLLSGSVLSIAETISISNDQVAVDIPYASLDMLSSAPDDRVFYRVTGPDGQVATGHPDLPMPPPRRGDDTGWNEPARQFFDARYRGEEARFVALSRRIAKPGRDGWVQVQVGQTRRARDAFASDLVFASLVPILLMTLVALAVVWFGINAALRPLNRLSEELAARQPKELQAVRTPVPAELGPVVDSMNGFMLRLRDNIDRLRTFIADAAHQIRTPLAAIQAQAQLAEGGDVADVRDSLAAVERNAAKLSRLVNQMLSDATVQHRSEVRTFQRFDLRAVVEQSAREAVPITDDCDVRFTCTLESAPMVGDGVMLGEAVKNLIQNALSHGRSPDAEVAIELACHPDGYLLRVADRGPGIAPSDRERMFERFARGGGTAPGAGLGLAIVRQAIESHHGAVTLLDRPGGGLLIEVTLPRGGARR